jgi:hypothetical protein
MDLHAAFGRGSDEHEAVRVAKDNRPHVRLGVGHVDLCQDRDAIAKIHGYEFRSSICSRQPLVVRRALRAAGWPTIAHLDAFWGFSNGGADPCPPVHALVRGTSMPG